MAEHCHMGCWGEGPHWPAHCHVQPRGLLGGAPHCPTHGGLLLIAINSDHHVLLIAMDNDTKNFFKKKRYNSGNIHFQRVPEFVTPLPWVDVPQMQTKASAFLFWGLCLPNWEGQIMFHTKEYLALCNTYM